MYNPVVQQAFTYSTTDSARYGNTSFGNACLIAKQVLAANQGTRFIQITLGNWDMHQDIYGAQNPKGNNLFTLCPQFDNGVGGLLTDLASSGLLNSTLVVMAGEFGRTTGPVTPAGGRDHLLQQSVVFAGAGIHGRQDHRRDQRRRLRHDRFWLVPPALRQAGRRGSDDLLRHGHQLDHRALRRPVPSRL